MQMLNDSHWSGNYSRFGIHGNYLSKQVVLGAASLRKPESPTGLLFLGDCEFQQKLFLWLEHV